MGRGGWWAFVVLVVASLLALPLAPALSEGLRVATCRATGGGCGYVPVPVKCSVLSRDSSVASPMAVVRRDTSSEGGELLTTDKLMNGGAVITLSPRTASPPQGRELGKLVAARLGVRAVGGSSAQRSSELTAQYRFSRHDDADAWIDHYHRVEQPVITAAAGPGAAGLHAGVRAIVRSLGFTDPDAVGTPDAVTFDVPAQAAAAGAYSAATLPDHRYRLGATPRLTVDAGGHTTTAGTLWLADNQFELAASLASQLGMVADATYAVTSDAAGHPTRLVVTGQAGRRDDGSYLAADRLTRLREQGASRGPSSTAPPGSDAGRLGNPRTIQTVVLDLRSAANQTAFSGVFRPAGALTVVRLDPPAPAVAALIARMAADAVFLRTTTETQQGQQGRSTTRLLTAFSQDFAVPASRLAPLPGCSR